MIKNDRQYKVSRVQLEKFEKALQTATLSVANEQRPLLAKARVAALQSQLDELHADVQEYEDLLAGRRTNFEAKSIVDLPRVLIQARIASGLSQAELGDRLGMKEQQIQRYEATDYAGASLNRLRQVVDALDLQIHQEIFLPEVKPSLRLLFERLKQVGLSREFVQHRILSPAFDAASEKLLPEDDSGVALSAAERVSKIFDLPAASIFGRGPLALPVPAGSIRYKLPKGVDDTRLNAYTRYAEYLASILLKTLPRTPRIQIPTTFSEVRHGIIESGSGAVTLQGAIRYAQGLGVVVLPLNDAGVFHGAYLRRAGRHVVILKQKTASASRWLFDLIHELRHAGEDPHKEDFDVIEGSETAQERRESPSERLASRFAGEVLLNGCAEELAKKCVALAHGSVEELKSIVPGVAREANVSVDALANYMAFRLSLQKINWWGAANNLQAFGEDPWTIARDHLVTKIDFDGLDEADRTLLQQALTTWKE